MSRKSDNFPLVLLGGGLVLWLLFHAIWDILFEDWLKHQLEHLAGHTVAEMIERFGSVGSPALAAIATVWFLYTYIKVDLSQNLPAAPGLSIAFWEDEPFVYTATKYRCYRFRVKNETNALIGSCKAQMESAYKSDGTRIVGIPFSLRRSFSAEELFTLRGGEEIFIDLLAVPLDPQYVPPLARIAELGMKDWPEIGTGGTCFPAEATRFTVQVLSDTPPVRLALKYENDGKEWRVLRA
jgi:hypothetical protein